MGINAGGKEKDLELLDYDKQFPQMKEEERIRDVCPVLCCASRLDSLE